MLVSNAPWRRLVWGAIAAVVVVLAGGVAVRLAGSWEMSLSEALNRLHTGGLATLGDLLYTWAGPVPAVVVTVILTGLLLLVSRSTRIASTFAVTIAVTWLSMAVVKLAVDRPRPDAALLTLPYHPIQHDASYPSGHAAFLTVLAFALVSLIRRQTARVTAAVAAALLVASAALLLTIDAVHFPTDVVASVVWVLGVAPLVRALWVRVVLPRLFRPTVRSMTVHD